MRRESRPLRVLITGASGFVGGALLARLRTEAGVDALGLGRRELPHPDYRSLDLTAPDALDRLHALATAGAGGAVGTPFVPDVIVHAAARSAPWGTRAEFERENVGTTETVLRYAAALPVRPRIVLVSTASVLYRAADQLDAPGDQSARPPFVNHYAASKARSEDLVRAAGGAWVVLRPRAVFGEGDTTLFPRLLEAARSGALPRFRMPRPPSPARVVTSTHPASASAPPVPLDAAERAVTPTGILSDLIPIETLVEYLVRALVRPEVLGRTLVVTGGAPVDLQQTVERILAAAGLPAPSRTVSRRSALAAAGLVEAAWRLTRRPGEPPITRYSIIVYAFAKTFDARPARSLLGEPLVSTAAALDALQHRLAVRTQEATP